MRRVGGEDVQLSDEEAEMAVRSSDADEDGALRLDDFAKMMKEMGGGGAAGDFDEFRDFDDGGCRRCLEVVVAGGARWWWHLF
ncbi:hypothetical protein R6Q57_018215 [Mikania cordata]